MQHVRSKFDRKGLPLCFKRLWHLAEETVKATQFTLAVGMMTIDEVVDKFSNAQRAPGLIAVVGLMS